VHTRDNINARWFWFDEDNTFNRTVEHRRRNVASFFTSVHPIPITEVIR
jgi:hypothetical protein